MAQHRFKLYSEHEVEKLVSVLRAYAKNRDRYQPVHCEFGRSPALAEKNSLFMDHDSVMTPPSMKM